jgi:hypothetical protein
MGGRFGDRLRSDTKRWATKFDNVFAKILKKSQQFIPNYALIMWSVCPVRESSFSCPSMFLYES